MKLLPLGHHDHVMTYVDSSLCSRTQLINRASELKCPVLLSTGSKSAHNHTVHTLRSALITKVADKSKIEMVEIDGVANVLAQAVSTSL
jgi:hypothetical protein